MGWFECGWGWGQGVSVFSVYIEPCKLLNFVDFLQVIYVKLAL